MSRYRVLMAFTVDLPSDLAERERLYGIVDAGECVLFDLENDPATCLTEWDSEVVAVEEVEP